MNKESKNVAAGITIGAVLGFVAGLLLAPKSGKQTRQDITDHMKKIADQAEARLHAIQTELSERVDQAEEQVKKLGKKISSEAKESLAQAKKSREQAQQALVAFKNGQSSNEDLDMAVKNAHAALAGLKSYFQK